MELETRILLMRTLSQSGRERLYNALSVPQ